MSVITLTLLLPGKAVPVQSWTFETESLVRVGRAADNDVVLYSAVVSRHHLEIRQVEAGWEVVNLGANGAYINGEAIAKITVQDGMVIRLASSGPKIQIHIEPQVAPTKQKMMKLQPPQPTTPIEVPHDPTKETVVN
jgi:pSer/pThr/pTyr-binding forkhead associated (FHA) protein